MQIELYDKFSDPLAACERLGDAIAKSGLFGCDRKEQGVVLALACLAEKKSPFEITRTYDIIEGKLRKKALAALAEFRAAGGRHEWLKTGDDGIEAALKLTFDGQTITSRFTMEEARRAGLVKDRSNWVKSPANMLRARAISNGVAMLAPEIFAGEDDSEPSPCAAVLTLAPATVATAAAAKDDVKELGALGLAPANPQPDPVPETEAPRTPAGGNDSPVAAAPVVPSPSTEPPKAGGFASPEQVAQIEEIVGPHFDAAMKWFVREKWLAEGESLLRLTETRAARIIKQRGSWLRAIGAGGVK